MMIKERIFTIACSKKGGSKEMTASIWQKYKEMYEKALQEICRKYKLL